MSRRKSETMPDMPSTIKSKLEAEAKDFIRPYVERGDSVKSLLDGHMGHYEPGGNCFQIGNYFDTEPHKGMPALLSGKRSLLKLKRGEMAVMFDGQWAVFQVHELYAKICLED